MHRASVNNINRTNVPAALYEASKDTWDEALEHGEKFGYRNAQVTVLAPTGTIGFMMDCDTTGIEPDLALVKYKKLVGGGMIKIVNNTVPAALFKLGYTSDQTNAIVSYIDATGTIEGAPAIKDEHLPVFDCSFKPSKGTRTIHYIGHLRMMAAAQPFISGAISKTINMPENATVEEIIEAYIQAWKLGLKAVAIYRDGSKKAQPLSSMGSATAQVDKRCGVIPSAAQRVEGPSSWTRAAAPPRAVRHRLPDERLSITHKFNVGGHEGYLTVGLYKDGMPGEFFITMAKEGSTVSGLMDSFACAVSHRPCSTACRSSCCARSSRTPASSPAAGATIRTSATPSRSWITSSAGCSCASSPDSSRRCSTACVPSTSAPRPSATPDENGYASSVIPSGEAERTESRDLLFVT